MTSEAATDRLAPSEVQVSPDLLMAFDFRVPIDAANSDLPDDYRIRALMNPSLTMTALSVDETIWPQVERGCFEKLVQLAASEAGHPDDPSAICDSNDLISKFPYRWIRQGVLDFPVDVCVIGLSVTSETAVYLRSLRRAGLLYEPSVEVGVLQGAGWKFLGYDVADKMLYSPLMNADLGSVEREEIAQEFRGGVNAFGLFSEREWASRFGRLAGDLIVDHAPYFPVGLWLHPQSDPGR